MKYVYLLAIALTIVACSDSAKSSTSISKGTAEQVAKMDANIPQEISSDQLQTMIGSGKEVVLLDVRTPGEIADGKIAGAIEADYKNDNFSAELDKLDKDKHYVVYCKKGGRSSKSIDLMKEKGFTKCTNLKGGYTDWASKK